MTCPDSCELAQPHSPRSSVEACLRAGQARSLRPRPGSPCARRGPLAVLADRGKPQCCRRGLCRGCRDGRGTALQRGLTTVATVRDQTEPSFAASPNHLDSTTANDEEECSAGEKQVGQGGRRRSRALCDRAARLTPPTSWRPATQVCVMRSQTSNSHDDLVSRIGVTRPKQRSPVMPMAGRTDALTEPRSLHPFSGLLDCGSCDGPMVIAEADVPTIATNGLVCSVAGAAIAPATRWDAESAERRRRNGVRARSPSSSGSSVARDPAGQGDEAHRLAVAAVKAEGDVHAPSCARRSFPAPCALPDASPAVRPDLARQRAAPASGQPEPRS